MEFDSDRMPWQAWVVWGIMQSFLIGMLIYQGVMWWRGK